MSKYVIKPKTKWLPCRHCQKPMEVGWKTKKLPAHVDCSVRAATEVMRQMSAKSGPIYDAWLAAMAKKFASQIPGGGGGAENVHRST